MAPALDILILAAGRGTRMRSDLPKVLHHLLGEPLIHHVVSAARTLRPRELGVIVGHQRERVQAALSGQDVSFLVQKEQLGTGHAIKSATRRFAGRDGDVMVLSGDVPLMRAATLAAFLANHRRKRAALSLMSAVLPDPGSLGRVLRDVRGNVQKIVEFRDASPDERAVRETNSGIYLFRSDLLFDGLKRLRPHPPSGEYYLTDLVRDVVADGHRVQAWVADDPDEGAGINTPEELIRAQDLLKARLIREHQEKGVVFMDPRTTFLMREVSLGPGTVIWPFSVLEAGVKIGARCTIGPFARLRAGTVLEDESRIGNFVEVKNSTLGHRSVAAHLTYLGDAQVGDDVNIGAGTITANFDGFHKNKTKIGDRVRVGSGTIFVAPVDIGSDAVTGAGSVVLKGRDVPDSDVVAGVPAVSLKRRPLERPERSVSQRKRKQPTRKGEG